MSIYLFLTKYYGYCILTVSVTHSSLPQAIFRLAIEPHLEPYLNLETTETIKLLTLCPIIDINHSKSKPKF